jgi:GT2 family glycosyltransferase
VPDRPAPFVTAVVLNHRHADDTLRCVGALAQSDHPRLSIVVVDNDSGPDVVDRLVDGLEATTSLILSPENVGYAAGNNLGIRRALRLGADLVWLVNPDVVVTPDTLAVLIDATEARPAAGILGCRVLEGGSRPARVLFNGGFVDWERGGAAIHGDAGEVYDDGADPGPVFDVDYVTGAAMLVRAGVFRSVGLLPEEYFLYFEETDFNLRAARSGWEVVVAPSAVAWHFKRSTGKLPEPYYIYYYVRNRIVFGSRYSSVDPVDIVLDLDEFVYRWRGAVERNAPEWLPVYEELVETAIAHGLAGRTGRWGELEAVAGSARVA